MNFTLKITPFYSLFFQSCQANNKQTKENTIKRILLVVIPANIPIGTANNQKKIVEVRPKCFAAAYIHAPAKIIKIDCTVKILCSIARHYKGIWELSTTKLQKNKLITLFGVFFFDQSVVWD